MNCSLSCTFVFKFRFWTIKAGVTHQTKGSFAQSPSAMKPELAFNLA